MRKGLIIIGLILFVLISSGCIGASKITSQPAPTTTPAPAVTTMAHPTTTRTLIDKNLPDLSLSEFYEVLETGAMPNEVSVHGAVTEVQQIPGYTIVKITEADKELWVALSKAEVSEGINIMTTGILMVDFSSPTLQKTFDLILFSNSVEFLE